MNTEFIVTIVALGCGLVEARACDCHYAATGTGERQALQILRTRLPPHLRNEKFIPRRQELPRTYRIPVW